jgi:hypothetical protein
MEVGRCVLCEHAVGLAAAAVTGQGHGCHWPQLYFWYVCACAVSYNAADHHVQHMPYCQPVTAHFKHCMLPDMPSRPHKISEMTCCLCCHVYYGNEPDMCLYYMLLCAGRCVCCGCSTPSRPTGRRRCQQTREQCSIAAAPSVAACMPSRGPQMLLPMVGFCEGGELFKADC